MTRSILVTLLVLGSSSAAFARGEHGGDVHRDRGGEAHRNFDRGRGGVVRRDFDRDRGGVVRRDFDRDRGRGGDWDDRARWDRDRDRDARVRRDRDRDDVRWREPRVIVQPAPFYAPGVWNGGVGYAAPSGITLLAPSPLAGGGLYVSGGDASLTALRLSAAGGDTYVTQVVVEYADGDTQVIPVGEELEAQNPSLDLSLDRRDPVARILVSGQSEYGGQIAITGF